MWVGCAIGLLVFLLAGAAAGQDDPDLVQAFSRFLKTEEIHMDTVPDLYEGGYARINLYARDASLGGLVMDEVWIRLVGITLDVERLRRGRLKILEYRGTAFHARATVQRLQEYFVAGNAFKDIRLWSDGKSLYGEGTVVYRGAAIKVWLKGHFSVSGTTEIFFHVENVRINGFPLFAPIIRIMEGQINPIVTQKTWPVTFTIRSLRMTTDGFVLSSQTDALAPCAICGSTGETSGR